MRNYIQPGNTLSLTAPYAVSSGDGFLVGNIFAVAACDADNGAPVEGTTVGVFDLDKVSAQAWTAGAAIYWDNTAKLCTTTVSTNTLIGAAVEAAANPSSTGRVRLNGAITIPASE
jgi:predicted RecA/RadA family phage recombinase